MGGAVDRLDRRDRRFVEWWNCSVAQVVNEGTVMGQELIRIYGRSGNWVWDNLVLCTSVTKKWRWSWSVGQDGLQRQSYLWARGGAEQGTWFQVRDAG